MPTKQQSDVFGLTVESEFPLRDLPALAGIHTPDVVIRRGVISSLPDDEQPGLNVIEDRSVILNIPEVARFEIVAGERITIEAKPSASERNIRLYLLGSAFGIILHQRGLLPLHANVIEIAGVAVAFMGHSGAGKSTMAAWFHDRGFRVLGDDVCVVVQSDSNVPVVPRGLPRLRLWKEALQLTGRTPENYEKSFDDIEKYDVPAFTDGGTAAIPLAAIYDLRTADMGDRATIVRLRGLDAVDALVANTYRGGYLQMLGGKGRHLSQCLRLAKEVPVFRAERRWGLEVYEEQAKLLESHARKTILE